MFISTLRPAQHHNSSRKKSAKAKTRHQARTHKRKAKWRALKREQRKRLNANEHLTREAFALGKITRREAGWIERKPYLEEQEKRSVKMQTQHLVPAPALQTFLEMISKIPKAEARVLL